MIAAIVLAAGLSKRMGKPKMTLPWGGNTVLGQVLTVIKAAGITDALVVTGAERQAIEAICMKSGVRTAHNPDYALAEMLSSLQVGLQAASPSCGAALVVLGDQPAIQSSIVQAVVGKYMSGEAALVAPSYQRRRGHPWLLARDYWEELLAMRSPETPRDFLNRHASSIQYVETDSASILQDIDTPEEYARSRP